MLHFLAGDPEPMQALRKRLRISPSLPNTHTRDEKALGGKEAVDRKRARIYKEILFTSPLKHRVVLRVLVVVVFVAVAVFHVEASAWIA